MSPFATVSLKSFEMIGNQKKKKEKEQTVEYFVLNS